MTDARRAEYHRMQRKSIESALRVARWDQQGAPARSRPNNYLESVEYLLDGLTFEALQQTRDDYDIEPQLELGDFGSEA